MKKIIFALFLLFIAFSASYTQTNPFCAPDNISNNNDHWMFIDTFRTVTGNWNSLASLQEPLLGINSYYWQQNDKVFICGGANDSAFPVSTCSWYNIAVNSYETAASLPKGRWSGKLVKVRDSLYLIGSRDSSLKPPDGIIYKYSLTQNTWVLKDTMPAPFVYESAVCVFNDSLIFVIGGSTNGFLNPRNFIRIYNPWQDSWKTIPSLYPVNITTAHAEYSSADTSIVVMGGYGNGNLNAINRGHVTFHPGDSTLISWSSFGSDGTTPFGTGVYRVAGAKWNNYMLFGPAMNGSNTIDQIWGLEIVSRTVFNWIKFDPGSNDTAGMISTFGAKSGTDSNYFFLFGGYKNPAVVSSARKYTFGTPPPIGIIAGNNTVPENFILYQNFPNPFNPNTRISFSLPKSGKVELSVHDILGREVRVLINDFRNAGEHEISFDASSLSSGIYFYTLLAGDFRETRKMMLIK